MLMIVLGEVTFAIVGVLFLLSAIRTFVSTLYQMYFGVLPNNTLGAIALVLFGAAMLAPLVARILGARRAVVLTAATLAVSMVLATASRNSFADLVLTGVAVLGGLWWLALVHAFRTDGRSSPLAAALPIAIVLDSAARAAFHTVPIVDQPLALALPTVGAAALVLLASGLASLPGERTWTSPGLRGAIALVALPLLLVVGETSGTNPAQVAAAAGFGLGPEPARSVEIGAVAIGVGLAAGAFALWRPRSLRRVAAVALAVGGALLWAHIPVLSLVGGAVLAGGVLAASAALTSAPSRPAGSGLVVSLALAVGWLAFVVVAFVLHAFYLTQAVWIATAAVALAALVAPGVPAPPLRPFAAFVVAAIAVAVPVSALLPTLNAPAAAAPSPTLRLMTYNVHQGFDAYDVPSLDAIVETIAHEAPDVVLLQEVVRGWIIDDQHDVLSVLALRLGMSYVWQPNIGDLYGNAILSRMPMTDVRRVAYAKEPEARYQQRGALFVRVADVLVIATHLDEHADASAIRQEQIRTLLRNWDGAPPAVVACDCNATPEALEMALLGQAGFADLGLSSGARDDTFSSDQPRERIDYVWGIGVTPAQGHVVDSKASDHRPVVVNITRAVR